MTEAPGGVPSGTCHKVRGCHGPVSSNHDGDSGPKHSGLGCNYPLTTGGSGSTEPGTCPEPNEEGLYVVCKRKCGCTRTSDKIREALQSFPTPPPSEALQTNKTDKASGFSYGHPEKLTCHSCSKPKEVELGAGAGDKDIRSASAIVQHKMKDKASGYSYGQFEKHYCRTLHNPKEAQLGILACGSAIMPGIMAETLEKDKMDSCLRCIANRRRLRQATEEDEKPSNDKEKQYCGACKPQDCSAGSGSKDDSAIVSVEDTYKIKSCGKKSASSSRSWQIVSELVSLVQLSVTATALALYYLIYCYMQLVYYTLRSALYFHNADGPMKITIGVVTLTSLIVGFNILMRMEGIIGIVY